VRDRREPGGSADGRAINGGAASANASASASADANANADDRRRREDNFVAAARDQPIRRGRVPDRADVQT
jgi:hypothetical protein